MKGQIMILISAVIAYFLLTFHTFYFRIDKINPIVNFKNEVEFLFNYPNKLENFSKIFEKIYDVKISIAYCNGTKYYNYSAIVLECDKYFKVNLTLCNKIVTMGPIYIPYLNFKKETICYCIKYKNLIDLKCI